MTDVLAEPAPQTPAGERIIAAASELFYARGIRGVGVDTIAEAAGTTKKTLYDRFGSKDELVSQYLVRRARRWQAYLVDELDRRPPGPDCVLAVFDALGEWWTERGCAFINAYAEVGGTDHPAVPVIRAEKRWMRERFRELVAEVGVAEPERVATTMYLLYEGALVTSTAAADPDAIRHARDAAERLLG